MSVLDQPRNHPLQPSLNRELSFVLSLPDLYLKDNCGVGEGLLFYCITVAFGVWVHPESTTIVWVYSVCWACGVFVFKWCTVYGDGVGAEETY